MGQQIQFAESSLNVDGSCPPSGYVPSLVPKSIRDDVASPYDQISDARLRAVAFELSQLVAGDHVVVGDIPVAIAELIANWVTTTTFVTFDVRTHYQRRHRETRKLDVELEILRTVLDPDKAMLDKKYPNSVNMFRSIDEGFDLMVSISISTNVDRQNRVKSARTHPKSRMNELLADQNRNEREWKK